MAGETVKVPAELGDKILISYDGDPPTTYDLSGGSVEVETNRLERFLVLIEGSNASGGTTDASDEGDNEQ